MEKSQHKWKLDGKLFRRVIRRIFWIVLFLIFCICSYVYVDIHISQDREVYESTHDTKARPFSGEDSLLHAIRDFVESNLTGVTATIIASFASYRLYERYLIPELIKQEERDFARLIADYGKRDKNRGVLAVKNKLSFERVGKLIALTSKTVIVETWIDPRALAALKPGIFKALDEGYSIVIYMLHPNSVLVGRRRLDIDPNGGYKGKEPSHARDSVIDSLEAIKSIRDDWVETRQHKQDVANLIFQQLVVYCYDSFPGIQLYRLQDRFFVGFFLNNLICSDGVQLEVDIDSKLGTHIEDHIEGLLHRNKGFYYITVSLTSNIREQFASRHLVCQINDGVKQVVNLNPEENTTFLGLLLEALIDRDRIELLPSRKANLFRLLEQMKTMIEEINA